MAGLVHRLRRDLPRYATSALVPALLSLVAVSVFTRLFTPDDYGRYTLAVATAGTIGALVGGWIHTSVLRYIPRYAEAGDRQRFLGSVVYLLLAIAVLVALVAVVGYAFAGSRLGAYRSLYWPAAAFLVASVAFDALGSTLMGELRSSRYVAVVLVNAVLRFAFALGFVLLVRRDVVGLIIGAVLAYLVSLVTLGRFVGVGRARWWKGFDRRVVRELAAYGMPMVGWAFGAQFLALSDRYVIAAFRDPSEVGIYSANYALVMMAIGLVAGPLMNAVHPLVMNAWERGVRENIAESIAAFSRYYLVLVVPVLAVGAVLAKDVVTLVLGSEYREGFMVVPLVLAGAAAWGFAMYGHKGLELMERTGILLGLVGVAAAVNIVLNLVFVPRFGYVAAAVTTLVSYAVYPILVFFVTRRYLAWVIPWSTVVRTGVAAVCSVGAATLLRVLISGRIVEVVAIGTIGAGGLAVYAAVLVALGEFRATGGRGTTRRLRSP
jgi:O-antigen/teichoic acid export membrane protein